MFEGQNTIHGVLPYAKLSDDFYRYSIVFYTLERMWSCLPIDDELSRIKEVETNRELKRILELTNG